MKNICHLTLNKREIFPKLATFLVTEYRGKVSIHFSDSGGRVTGVCLRMNIESKQSLRKNISRTFSCNIELRKSFGKFFHA